MTTTRRRFLQQMTAGVVGAAAVPSMAKPLQFVLPPTIESHGLNADQRLALSRATLDTLQAHFKGKKLATWGKNYDDIDFEKRISNIVYWVDKGIREAHSIYAVDPIWVLGQIMAESMFCEYAVSPSMAAGICQFMPRTASVDYEMVVAGSRAAHHHPPYVALELSKAYDDYNRALTDRRAYIRSTAGDRHYDLTKALLTLANGNDPEAKTKAEAQLARDEKLKVFQKDINQAVRDYKTYIRRNVAELGNNDLFGHTDFFVGFDERLTYRKPIMAMTNMLARALKNRGGNILVAAAGYNAGLSRTYTSESLYTDYGFIPNFNETATYLSRIVANYEEISQRYYG